ncbi:MAG: hypothetical protein K2M42_02660 [Oscillospiraceae bacterium]|nr:hypothetical protein [Oscillospiraceae bacterium]
MRRCCCGSQGQGGDLVASAAALSVLIAQGKTAEQIELLSAVFDMLADNLATLALKAPSEEDCCRREEARAEDQNESRCP